jgi:addiction module HigA family antidote
MVRSGFKLPIIINSTHSLKFPEGEFSRKKEKSNMVRIPSNGPPTHPGEMLLEEFLEPLGMSQSELAAKLGVSYPRINELVHGKRGITPDTALRLEQFFGMEAQFWLNLQLAWDLYQLIHSPAAKRIRRIKRLPALEARASH